MTCAFENKILAGAVRGQPLKLTIVAGKEERVVGWSLVFYC